MSAGVYLFTTNLVIYVCICLLHQQITSAYLPVWVFAAKSFSFVQTAARIGKVHKKDRKEKKVNRWEEWVSVCRRARRLVNITCCLPLLFCIQHFLSSVVFAKQLALSLSHTKEENNLWKDSGHPNLAVSSVISCESNLRLQRRRWRGGCAGDDVYRTLTCLWPSVGARFSTSQPRCFFLHFFLFFFFREMTAGVFSLISRLGGPLCLRSHNGMRRAVRVFVHFLLPFSDFRTVFVQGNATAWRRDKTVIPH